MSSTRFSAAIKLASSILFTRGSLRIAAASLALTALAAGCASNNAKQNSGLAYNRGVTDITPLPPSSPAAAPTYTSIPAAPVSDAAYSTNYTDYAASASSSGPAASSGGRTYIVKKGDTLYKIAREHYGDAKAWHKIAAANPAAANGMIKVGQKLVLP